MSVDVKKAARWYGLLFTGWQDSGPDRMVALAQATKRWTEPNGIINYDPKDDSVVVNVVDRTISLRAPCGQTYSWKFGAIPMVDVPCRCGDPNHTVVCWRES